MDIEQATPEQFYGFPKCRSVLACSSFKLHEMSVEIYNWDLNHIGNLQAGTPSVVLLEFRLLIEAPKIHMDFA